MSDGGGKGGSSTTTTKVKLPEWVNDASKRNLARADEISKVGYVPDTIPGQAAFTPMQEAAMRNTNHAAKSLGMVTPQGGAMAGMPEARDFGGIRGYSSMPIFNEAKSRLRENRPHQFNALASFGINPRTGAQPDYAVGVMDQLQRNEINKAATTNNAQRYFVEHHRDRGDDWYHVVDGLGNIIKTTVASGEAHQMVDEHNRANGFID